MRDSRLAMIALVLLAAVPCRASGLESLEFFKPVQRAQLGEEEILAVSFDPAVYAATQEHFADVRVVATGGKEVPFRIDQATETRSETSHRFSPSEVRSLVTKEEDNSIEVIVELDKKAVPADGMTFYTPLRDFERHVSVFGSNDGADWRPLVSRAMIFDYSQFMDVSNREVKLPENDYRRLKVVIEEVIDQKESALMELTRQFRGGDETQRTERTTVQRRPFRIDRIELWHEVVHERVKKILRADYPIVDFEVEEDPGEKMTIVHVRTRREPLVRFTLETTSANFNREAFIEVPVERGVTVTWKHVGHGSVSRFRFRNFEREELQIDFPEQRQKEYRILIENEDNPPLEITAVKAEGQVYRALFIAAPETNYQLYYGSDEAEAPSYDTAALAVALAEGFEPAVATLGTEAENPDFGRAPGLGLAELLNNPLFFAAAICLMVIVLALLLFRAGRRIEGLPEEGDV